MSSKISRKTFNESVREISTYVNSLERQLENAKKEIASLKKELSKRTSLKKTKPATECRISKKICNNTSNSTWKEILLETWHKQKSPGEAAIMYEKLFKMIPPNDQRKGKLQAYAIRQFDGEFPQELTWREIKAMKDAYNLTKDQVEIYYAINSFKEACSRLRKQLRIRK